MAERIGVCDYSYNEEKQQLRVNCLGCLFGASLEDFDECMARTIDKILEVKKVTSIVLAKEREYEYDYEQTKMLAEIARIIEDVLRERLISAENLGTGRCRHLAEEWSSKMQYLVLDLLRKDPIGAYVELLREIRHIHVRMKRVTNRELYTCVHNFLTSVLEPLKKKLEATRLIQAAKPDIAGYHIGDRGLYRQIFMPSVRPNFMLTRYIITPPEQGRSVDRYEMGDTKVEIFRMPDTTEYMYFVLPPEFTLPMERYTVLDAARRYMATHRPKTAEFVKSKRVREVFYNIGRDMIREVAGQMKVELTAKETDQLANILTRYTAGLGVLEILLADERVQDIFINSPVERQPILITHQDWEECRTNLIPTMEDAEAWATRLRIQSGRPLDEANPVLDTDMAIPGGQARFALITRTLSPHGLGFAIRRHRDRPWTLPLFIKNRMINPMAAGLLSFFIDGTVSMLVAGGRGAGKTSVLGSLMLEILPKTRVVSIQDSVTGDCEMLFHRKGRIERDTIGNLVDGLIKKSGRRELGRDIVKGGGIKVYSIDEKGKVVLKPATRFIRHKVNKDIYEITTRTGRKIKVTGDHSLFSMGNDGSIQPVKCRELCEGDYIVTPRVMHCRNKKIPEIDLMENLGKLRGSYITGKQIRAFVNDNKHIVSKLAGKYGYYVEGPLRGMTQYWKRENILPTKIVMDLQKRGLVLPKEALRIKYKPSASSLPVVLKLDKDFLTFLGLWVADGCYYKNSVIMSVAEREARNVVRRVAKQLGLVTKMHSDGFSLMINSKALLAVMKHVLGLKGNAFTKRLPDWVYGLSREQKGYVLKGILSGDGCVSDKEILISLRSEGLIKDIQTLLLSFGIIGRCNERSGFFHCRVSALSSLKEFREQVGMLQRKKAFRLNRLCRRISTHDSTDVIPLPLEMRMGLFSHSNRFSHQDYILRGNNVGRAHLGNLASSPDFEEYENIDTMKSLAGSDIFWDSVKSIRRVEHDGIFVYDISVPGTENFICENILAHNTLELPIGQLRELGYNVESLKSRSVITRVETEMPADEALRTALRLGDSALIVGEVRSSVRGNEEVVIVDDGVMKRTKIRELYGKDLSGVYVPTVGFDLKVKLSKLTDFVKHPKRKRLLKVKTRTGREVTVTPDHSLFAPTKEFEIAPKECKELRVGDQIVIPSQMPCGFNDIDSINVFDYLPEFRVQNFESDVRRAIRFMGWRRATEICDIGCGDIYNYFRVNQKTNIPYASFSKLMRASNLDYDVSNLSVKRGTSLPIPAEIPVNEDFCRFLGYYVAEGYYSLKEKIGGGVIITNSNPEIIEDISGISRSLFGLSPKRRVVKGLGTSVQNQFHCLPMAKLISQLGCGRTCAEKRVPPIVFGLSSKKIAAFLRGLYSGDGCFTSSKSSGNTIRYFSTSRKLVEDVSYLLLNFGIVARIRESKRSGKAKRKLWTLEFKDRRMVKTFLSEIGFVGKKAKMVERQWSHTVSNSVIFDREMLKRHLIEYPRRYRHLFRFLRCSKNYLTRVVEDPDCQASEKLTKFAKGDFFLDEVSEIKEIKLDKAEHVYDLSVEPTENFIGGFGGILLHNTEAKSLYEAMRIGALSNVVAGTIHGESAYGVYDRVVNDLGVPKTSFKATDILPICKSLRSADGLHRFRRMTEITEVRKDWEEDPMKEEGFVNLMEYSGKKDELLPTDTLKNGESEVINRIASYVKEWSDNWSVVWDSILMRAQMKEALVRYAEKLKRPEIMEAEWVIKANNMYHLISEAMKKETGFPEPKAIYQKWEAWLKKDLKA